MKRWPINHLTADDLDAFHSASLNVEAREHLDECEECRAMALLDQRVLDALAALPSYAPGPEFAERVLARVRRPEPAIVRLVRPRTSAGWVRVAFAASAVVSLGASIVWSLFNRDLLLSWIHLSAAETGRTVWLGVRMVATNLTAQPWYAPLREFASSPGRLAALVGGSLIAYGVALVALRRLLTPPSRPVPHAHG
jgi:predicted anti-sigma-YlaC factor YlaD